VEDKTDPRLGMALHVPKLKLGFPRVRIAVLFKRLRSPRFSGPLLDSTGSGFLPLHGETDEQREFGLAIPVRGWTLDFLQTSNHARNFFDHDAFGSSNIFLPLTIERARIHGWETTVRSSRIKNRFDVFLTYSNQLIEGAGVITGGLISDPGQLCGSGRFCYLDHDQRNTLSTGFHAALPWHAFLSGRLGYGSAS